MENNSLKAKSVRELQTVSSDEKWEFNCYLDNFPSIEPIKGIIFSKYQENKLFIKGKANTIITLICDRCFNEFSKSLEFDTEEIIVIASEENSSLEFDLLKNEKSLVMDYLSPHDKFDPAQWLYENLNLQMPLINYCKKDCEASQKGILINHSSDTNSKPDPKQIIDPRWSSLTKLI